MGLGSPRRTRAAFVLLALTLAAAAIDGSLLWQQRRLNALIAAGQVPSASDDRQPQVQFARASAQAASGADDDALRHYRSLHDDAALGPAARYNSANLLMRQAIAVRAGNEPGKAIALIELAKELYRDVLRVDPQHWPARYNLERAQRLLADPDESETPPPEAQSNPERAATTMRGDSPGLP